MDAPVVVKPVPVQITNELSAYGPFHLSSYIEAPDRAPVRFQAELTNGQSLPKGLICSGDGILTGIPAKNTSGQYELLVRAENEAGAVTTTLILVINPNPAKEKMDDFDQLKSEIWEALEKNLPIPDLMEAFGRPITIIEVYYLLERWGVLKIWDVFNLEPPGEKVPLSLEGVSKHYQVYDRGSCLVAVPKELFSHERTLADGLQTARALAQEAYKRRWAVELVGFEKLTRAAWVEIQRLGDLHGKPLDVINYPMSSKDVKLHATQNLSVNRPEME